MLQCTTSSVRFLQQSHGFCENSSVRRPVSLKTEPVAPLKALVLMRLRLMAINCSDRTPIHLSCWLRRQLGVCQFLPGRVCTRGRGDPQTPKYLSVSLQLVTIKIL